VSGPKCYGYQVVEDPAVVAARQEAAALSQARNRIETTLAKIGSLAAEAASLRDLRGGVVSEIRVPSISMPTTSKETARTADELDARLADAQTQLQRERAAAREASFLAQIRVARTSVEAGPDGRKPSKESSQRTRLSDESPALGTRPPVAGDRKLVEDSTRIFARIRADASDRLRADAERTMAAVLAADGSERVPMLLDRLRGAVEKANAEAAGRKLRHSEVDALLVSLGSLAEPEASRLRARLIDERSEGHPTAELTAIVEQAQDEARRKEGDDRRLADRAHVADALRAAFSDLGYDVQSGFETALAERSGGFVRRAGWSRHAVRVALDERTHRLRMHVVRDDSGRPAGMSDATRERELCADRVRLERALASRGVQLDAQELLAPGSVPVAKVAVSGLEFVSRHRVSGVAGEGAL
jgi:hypothetical protein